MPKQRSSQRPSPTPDEPDEDVGLRGEVTRHGGTKVHGDDLEGAIPTTPMTVDRPSDGDERNDKGPPK
jgi:hypothetical protein